MAIHFGYWNMYWMNDLFESEGAAKFKPDDYVQPQRDGHSTLKRRKDLAAVIDQLNLDVLVVTEGPNRQSELQLFFDTDVQGSWRCELQPTKSSQQCIGIAVRTDTGKLDAAAPVKWFDLRDVDTGGGFARAVRDFTFDSDDDEILETYRFERLPLYCELKTADNKPFRVLGLHLKSKGIFSAYEWSKWWSVADANRRKIVAQATTLRLEGIEPYLEDPQTAGIPLVVCGDINDGPGMDASEKRLNQSGIESLMGDVWRPASTLRNALYDSLLTPAQKKQRSLDQIATTSFRDQIFNNTYHRVWIDHILYTPNGPAGWVANGKVHEKLPSGDMIWRKFPAASDHFPVSVEIAL